MKKAFILCSGGLDSVVAAYYVKKRMKYSSIKILFFNYGQRNLLAEKAAAKKCSRRLKAGFEEVKLKWLGEVSKSLINVNKKAKQISRKNLKDTSRESKNWYVPARNLLFLSYAISLAEAEHVKSKDKVDLFVGFKNEGVENFPDTTPRFVKKLNDLTKESTDSKTKVIAPLIRKDKEDIVRLGVKLGVNFRDTFSCYIGGRIHCGYCLACRLRQEGFYWANVNDPTKYKTKMKDFRLAEN